MLKKMTLIMVMFCASLLAPFPGFTCQYDYNFYVTAQDATSTYVYIPEQLEWQQGDYPGTWYFPDFHFDTWIPGDSFEQATYNLHSKNRNPGEPFVEPSFAFYVTIEDIWGRTTVFVPEDLLEWEALRDSPNPNWNPEDWIPCPEFVEAAYNTHRGRKPAPIPEPATVFLITANENRTVGVRFGNLDGTFEAPVLIGDNVGSNYGEFAIADFTGDGPLDFIAATNGDPSRLYLFARTGPNTFDNQTLLFELDPDPKAAYWLGQGKPLVAPDYGMTVIWTFWRISTTTSAAISIGSPRGTPT